PWKERIIGKLIESTFPYPERLEAALLPIRVLRRTGVLPLLHRIGFMKALGKLGEMEMLLPPLPPMHKRINFPEQWQARGQAQANVGIITGCVMQVMQSQVNEATARVLTKAGCNVAVPKTQGCCGALHAHSGGMHEAKELAKKNIEVFEAWQQEHGELDAIIINAAGCGAALKEYAGWFKDNPEWAERARTYSDKVKDVSEFLAQPQFKDRLTALMPSNPQSAIRNPQLNDVPREVIPNTTGSSTLQALNGEVQERDDNQQEALNPDDALNVDTSLNGRRPHDPYTPPAADAKAPSRSVRGSRRLGKAQRATYHDACHLAHGQSVRSQPRELLDTVPNVDMVPLGESEMCCGSAGIYNITQPEMAMQLLQRKMEHIKKTGATIVVTGNPGCMMQIMLGARKFDVPIKVCHPIELLDAATK
ncbi:MAG: (Fe-S)-binding protein, partial [Abitibacteriaceae bacterium]|nr:(Fe-S)-binding protein [Abditibacteriaceae bacterium]